LGGGEKEVAAAVRRDFKGGTMIDFGRSAQTERKGLTKITSKESEKATSPRHEQRAKKRGLGPSGIDKCWGNFLESANNEKP